MGYFVLSPNGEESLVEIRMRIILEENRRYKTYLYINLRRSRDVLVLLFLRLFVTLASFSSLWPAFTLTVHINALYNESVYGMEEHAT